ncbi:MAG TPA: nucleoside-diphosphate sugar epimerase/dehydratase, partial [Blastocatellia bacterium]|nr:nucleoside-diphosphate sugar epimerase/dehydratase [Blastocatellia bacterium]
MSVSKQFIPQTTGPPHPSKTKTDLSRRLAQAVVLRPWVRNLLSRRVQMVIDVAIATTSFILAHILRFDGWPPGIDNDRLFLLLPYVVLARLGVNHLMGLYCRVWRYVSIPDGIQLAVSVGIISTILLALRLIFPGIYPLLTVPISITFIDLMLATSLMLCARLVWRVTCENAARAKTEEAGVRVRTLLVGAGNAGIMTVREISRRRDLGLQVCGFVDDNPSKRQAVIQGVPVLGVTSELPALVKAHRIQQVIITITSAHRKTVRRLLDLCEEARVPVKILPGLSELLGNRVTITKVRPIEIEDLLGRDTIDLDLWFEASQRSYWGKRVLVTGAGGSIGRELCRQLATLQPATIILLDKDENAVFEAERELLAMTGDHQIEIVPLICDLRVAPRLWQSFRRHLPQVVFHAAAHKHVPLLESNVPEAVLNNILGTARLLECAAETGVERCVMVSTDKAVNPTNIMGATKRVAELMFQAQVVRAKGMGHYSCVRFGNVLGSRGSVVPIFREQIRNGGPVTVTHPEVERYFMTIPEAAQLIIQAGALGQRGEIFLLDMGEPVKVIDLANDMIRLSGLTLGEDLEMVFTGLRPGEKLKEELLIAEEGAQTTRYEKIFVAPPLQYDFDELGDDILRLIAAAEDGNEDEIYKIFSAMRIGFRPTRQRSNETPIIEGQESP